MNFVQFKDFEYLPDDKTISVNIKIVVYAKALDVNRAYLGSLRFGLYTILEGVELKKCINDIICQNYPTYLSYESDVTLI